MGFDFQPFVFPVPLRRGVYALSWADEARVTATQLTLFYANGAR